MTRVLVTGFEPFDGSPVNASWEAVQLLAERWDGDAELVIRELPVAFGSAGTRLMGHLAFHTPDAVVATGVAPGRRELSVERLAVNLRDAGIPDNRGHQPRDELVISDGPAAYWSTLPVSQIVHVLREARLPASASLSAGSFVCNDTFFTLQHAVATVDVPAGFVHVPAIAGMNLGAEVPTMDVEEIALGLAIAVDVTLNSMRNNNEETA